jgi:stage III sporulation protein SpoIIIAA
MVKYKDAVQRIHDLQIGLCSNKDSLIRPILKSIVGDAWLNNILMTKKHNFIF